MSLFSRKALLEIVSPYIQAKRFRSKINIQKPKPPHFLRSTYLAVAKPYFEKKKTLPMEVCQKNLKFFNKNSEENPYERIIANELATLFKSSRLIAFFHMNSMTSEQHYKAYVLFHKQNMLYKNYGKDTLKMALKGSPYEAVLKLFVSHNMIVFSPETQIKKLVQINKKFPQLVLMAGVMDGHFLSKDELIHYSNIPNLVTAQADFVQTLNSIGGQIVNQLNSHQTVLVSQLGERIKQLEDGEPK